MGGYIQHLTSVAPFSLLVCCLLECHPQWFPSCGQQGESHPISRSQLTIDSLLGEDEGGVEINKDRLRDMPMTNELSIPEIVPKQRKTHVSSCQTDLSVSTLVLFVNSGQKLTSNGDGHVNQLHLDSCSIVPANHDFQQPLCTQRSASSYQV